MPTAFCTTCGSRRHGDHRFCTSCGQPFDPSPSRHDDPEATASKPLGPSAGAPPPRLPRPGVFPAPPAARSRGPLVAAAVGGLALVVVASAVTFTLVTDGGRGGGYTGDRLPLAAPAADGATQVDLLSEPTSEWSFDASSVGPGGVVGDLGLPEEGAAATQAIVTVGDTVVVGVYAGTSVLVGLNATDGTVRWERDDLGGVACDVLPPAGLVCTAAGDGSGSTTTLLDPETGDALASRTGPSYARQFVVDDTVHLLANDTTGPEVTALDPETLEEQWSTPLALPSSGLSGDPGTLTVTEAGRVVVDRDGTTWVVDGASGDLLDQRTTSDLYDGTYVVGTTGWTADSPRTTVTDLGGFAILPETEGGPWRTERADGWEVADGRMGIGGSLFDLTTGEEIWSEDVVGPIGGLELLTGGLVLSSDYDLQQALLLDPDTGEEVWSAPLYLDTETLAVAGDAAAYLDAAGVLTVGGIGGATGGWARDVSDVAIPPDFDTSLGVVEATPSAVVVAGETGVRGFTGFPAAGDDAGAEAAAGEGEAGTEYVTDCGTEPELTPVEAVAADGGVRVTFEMTATCPDGQWLAHDAVDVTMDVTTTGSDGTVSTQRLLLGRFDFATDPRWVPADGTEQALVFPPGSAFGTPEEINDAIAEDGGSGEVVRVGCEREDGATPGPVPADPGDAASGEDPVTSTGTPDGTDGDPEETALETLQRIAAKDAPYLDQNATSGWIAQLPSKDYGLVADGLTWTYEDILAEHLRLRLRYPETRLAWSTDWGSFQEDGYWVTVVATEPTPTPRPVLDFCVGESFDRDHCFAKRLARGGSSDGMIRMLPEA